MKVLFVSLGCDKNLVDTEVMLGILSERGYEFTDDEMEAEIAIVNSCCFIGDAKEESIQVILEMAELRKTGRLKALIVTGCLSQRYQDEVLTEIEEVDAILGIASIDQIADTLDEVLGGKKIQHFAPLTTPPLGGRKRIVTTGGHFSYLKIAEGCDKRCTYCVIPSVRGSYRSIPMEDLIKEATALVEGGVKELILVAQETTMYGKDLYGKKMLPELLHRLCKIPGLYWIRIMYCYPEEITPELVECMREEDKICNYLDIPIQHASDRVLAGMGRKTNRRELEEKIAYLRERIPDIALRTTLINGFPGETHKDHMELLEFVEKMRFDRLGAFPYSPEEGTRAFEMEKQVSDRTKKKRHRDVMQLQQCIAFDMAQEMVGRTLLAMIEGKIADEDVYVARTYRDAPNVDGFLFINTTANLMTGDFVKVLVTDSNEYDLIGELVDEFTE